VSKLALFIVIIVVTGCNQAALTQQRDAGWVKLFNGKDIKDWIVKVHHHEPGVNYGNTFRVEDGMIKVRYDQYGDYNNQFAHLYYKTPYSHFHLKLEYHFTGDLQQGAPEYTMLNSGVMFHSQDPMGMRKEQDWPISVEMQFLADLGDGKPRPTGNMCSPGTEIEYKGQKYAEHCLNSSSKTYSKDEWVKAELIVLGDSLITHIINGDTVLQYSRPTMGGGIANGFDSTIWKPGQPLRSGFIALQSEGQPIDFRNIELKVLK
jgi:hypothetical protein